jgi:bifunctional non-homologous end joining protein LigD
MLAKGDLKFRLNGKKLKGSFALIHMKARRPGSKGTEWLLIKHHDAYDQAGYDIDKYDYSVLTKRSLKQIAGDESSAEWLSSRKVTRSGSSKNDWLAESIAKADAKKAKTAKKSAAVKSSMTGAAKRSAKSANAPASANSQPQKLIPSKTSSASAASKKKSRLKKTA